MPSRRRRGTRRELFAVPSARASSAPTHSTSSPAGGLHQVRVEAGTVAAHPHLVLAARRQEHHRQARQARVVAHRPHQRDPSIAGISCRRPRGRTRPRGECRARAHLAATSRRSPRWTVPRAMVLASWSSSAISTPKGAAVISGRSASRVHHTAARAQARRPPQLGRGRSAGKCDGVVESSTTAVVVLAVLLVRELVGLVLVATVRKRRAPRAGAAAHLLQDLAVGVVVSPRRSGSRGAA